MKIFRHGASFSNKTEEKMSLAAKSTSILKRDVFLYVTKMFTSVIIARKLGPELLGVYVILMLIPSYAESFGRMKFDIAAVYFLGKKKYHLSEMVLTLNLLALVTSGLIVCMILFGFDWIYGLLFSKTKYNTYWLMCLILLQIPLHFLWMNYSYLLLHRDDIVSYNRMVIINALTYSLFGLFLLLILDLNLWAVAVATVLGTAVSLLYGIFALGLSGYPGKIINIPLIRDLFQYGMKLYVGGLSGHFQAYITNLLTALYLIPAQVAFFSIARGLGQMIDRVPAALNTVLFPRLTKISAIEEAARMAARAFRFILLLLVVVGLFSMAMIHPAVHLIYGSAFLPLVVPFFILIPAIILSGAATPLIQYFMSIDRADLTVTLPIPALAIQVMLALILIPLWGPAGAALAFSVGLVTFSFVCVWMFLRISPCTLQGDLMVRGEDLRYLVYFTVSEIGKIWSALMRYNKSARRPKKIRMNRLQKQPSHENKLLGAKRHLRNNNMSTNESNKYKRLVILSIPFQRVIRSHLSPMVLETLQQKSDVVIVSPFAEHPHFVKQYVGSCISHLPTPTSAHLSWLFRKMVTVSEIMRMRGYCFRNRKYLAHSWAKRHIQLGENGNDTIPLLPKRTAMDVLAWIGWWPRAWTYLDSIIGRWCFYIQNLFDIANQYHHVTLIQTSSWGFQDKALAWMGRNFRWRTVLLPYTTDQLYCNGYLYSDFDTICVQGTSEHSFAKRLHHIPDNKLVKLGSLNFFSIRHTLKHRPIRISKEGGNRRLLLAGSIATYYPTESEFDCLEYLLRAVEAGDLKNTIISYRPIGNTPKIRALIDQRFQRRDHLEIKYASPAIYGLEQYTSTTFEDIIYEHAESIAGFDLAVMVIMTSLALDLAVMGTPTIAFFDDPSGILQRRKTEMMFNSECEITGFEQIPCVMRKEDLVPAINRLLDSPDDRMRITEKILEAWDYNEPNISDLIATAVFGNGSLS